MREDIQAFGKHWYDDGNLGGRAFFGGENKTSYLSIENLKTTDQGAYRCRVDFKKAPSQIYKLYLEVVGKIFSLVAQRLPWLQSLPCHHGMCILLALNFCYIHSNVIHGNSTKRQNFKFLRESQCFSLRWRAVAAISSNNLSFELQWFGKLNQCALHVPVPPSEVRVLTQSGNALEDERYNEGTDLSLSCAVSGGNVL